MVCGACGSTRGAVIAIRPWRESWPGRLAPMLVAALLVFAPRCGSAAFQSAGAPFAIELTAVREPAGASARRLPLLLELDLTA